MNLQHLPLELLRAILSEAILTRGWRRGLRLRLVNRLFATEVINVLGPLRILDDLEDVFVQNTRKVGAAYISQRLLSRQPSISPRLDNIRQIASRFTHEDTEADGAVDATERYKEYIKTLSSLITRVCPYPFSRLFSSEPGQYGFENYDLCAAAAYLGRLPAFLELTEDGHNRSGSISTLGGPWTTCVWSGNTAIIDHLLEIKRSKWSCLELLSRVCEVGQTKTVEHILDSKWMVHPLLWRQYEDTSEFRGFHYNFNTPNQETFDAVMRYKQKTAYKTLTQEELAHLVCFAAANGWEDRVAHLLSLGAPIDGEEYIRRDDLLPLLEACRTGSDGVVRLLLQHNTRITGLEIGAAAAKGRLSTVRILLEHGADANGVPYFEIPGFSAPIRLGESPPPIVSAIRLENVEMFRLLVEHGADLKEKGPEAVKVARDEGLDSMLEILKEYGVSTEENVEEAIHETV